MLLDFGLLEWLVGFLLLIVLLAIHWRRKRSPAYLFCFSLFWVYLLFVVKETIFPIPVIEGWDTDMGWQRMIILSRVNLVPYFSASEARFLFLNILLTVPCGFGVSFIARLRSRDFLWLAVGVGLGIETAQLVISLGLGVSYRTIDINDVLLNAAGVLIGYGLFRLFAGLYLKLTQRLAIDHRGLSAYVHDIARCAGSHIKEA